MDRRWLSRFLTLARLHGKDILVQELFPEEDETTLQIRHNLPRRPYEQFVGREQELADLRRFLSPRHRVGVVCLSGVAGVGKTALALEIAHRFRETHASLPPDERFEAIVWVTAKRAELLPMGVTARRPTFSDLDGLYRALAEVLDLPAITRAATGEAQDIVVARALTEHRALLALDNLEDVDDPVLMVFLRDLPAPSKAIVTTRHRVDVAVPIPLRALNETAARELIHAECQRHRITLTDGQSDKLLQRTGGLPLAIVRTLGRMAWRGSNIEVELRQLGDPRSDIYDFCFEKSIALVHGSDAHRLFMALALFATDAAREALGHVAGLGEDVLSRDEGLSDLEVLSLVNKNADRFSLEPMTRVRALDELKANSEFKQQAQECCVKWYKTLAMQAGDSTDYLDLRLEVDNSLGVMEWLAEQEQMTDLGWFFRRIQKLLYAEGRWESLLRFADRVATWAGSVGDADMLAATLEHPINVFCTQGAFKRGEEWLKCAQVVAGRLDNELLQAEVLLAQGHFLYNQGVFEKGIKALTKALEIFQQNARPERIVLTLNTLGNCHRRRHCFEDATRFYQQGLCVLENSALEIPEASWWHTILQGNLGLVAGRQGRYAEARQVLREIFDDLTDQTDLAIACAALALYEFSLGNIEQARLFRRRANRMIKRLGLAQPICPEDAEWMQLHDQQA
jgi:tetratricopeptide (TPR) repeat protein